MHDLTERIADVVGLHQQQVLGDECDCGWWWDRSEGRDHAQHVAQKIATVIHPVIETVEQLDAQPAGTIVRHHRSVYELWSSGNWWSTGGGAPLDQVPLPASVIWTPPAGES